MSATGKVYLVGAGPGDPGLITMTGLGRLSEADVIIYDRLVNPRLLEEAEPEAELIYMGKIAGEGPHDQEAINQLLIEKAREGKNVVRLKGGDPFVFGRGGEEAEALRGAGIAFEVVPGVTSAVAVPAYAGIPVTHRGLASSFAVITAHEAEPPATGGSLDSQLSTLNSSDTLVFVMGVKALPDVVRRLIEDGRPPEMPVAVIRWGTTPEQETVVGTLADIVQRVQESGLTPPAITVVGEVVRLREKLAWFEQRPLFGKRVLITRTREQAGALARLLADEGAVPIELPSIEIEPVYDANEVDAAISRIRRGRYHWVVFTSSNAVDIFFDILWESDLDARVFGPSSVAAIGEGTAASLSLYGILPDLMPEEYVAEALVEEFAKLNLRGQRVLLPRAEGSRDVLIEGLEKQGAKVDELILYRAAVPAEVPQGTLSMLRDGGVDIVTFTASSTVRNLVSMLGGDIQPLNGPLIACIGPITAKTAEELGLRVDVVAEEHTVAGLVEAISEVVRR